MMKFRLNDSERRALRGKHLTMPLYPSRRLAWAQKRSSDLGGQRRFAILINDTFSTCRNFLSLFAISSKV